MSERKPAILRPSALPAHERGGGARTIPRGTRTPGAPRYIPGRPMFEPNAAIPLHSHNCDESVMLLEGHAIAEIDGVQHEVEPGDTTFIPANIPHRFINRSDTQGMKILWTYASVDATRTLIATGDTRPIDAEHKG